MQATQTLSHFAAHSNRYARTRQFMVSEDLLEHRYISVLDARALPRTSQCSYQLHNRRIPAGRMSGE